MYLLSLGKMEIINNPDEQPVHLLIESSLNQPAEMWKEEFALRIAHVVSATLC